MATWYYYTCMDCGYSGLTQDRDRYRRGNYACPRCGSTRFEVEERDAAPLPEEEDLGPEIDD